MEPMIAARAFVLPLLMVLFCIVSPSCAQSPPSSATPLSRFIDRFYDEKFALAPSAATDAGIHLYDNHLEDFSRGAVRKRIASLKAAAVTLSGLRSARLSADDKIDAQLIDNAIKAELLDPEKIKSWGSSNAEP